MPSICFDALGEETLAHNRDVICPFSFEMSAPGDLCITAFPQLASLSQQFLAQYASDPTHSSALSFLFAEMRPYMQKWGYTDTRFRRRWGYILTPTGAGGLSTIQATRIVAQDIVCNQTTRPIEAMCREGQWLYGVVEKGRLLSLSWTHAKPVCGQIVEIGVETAKIERGRGYATACLSALTQALIRLGALPRYRCFSSNQASLQTALSAGYQESGRFYQYIGRRI